MRRIRLVTMSQVRTTLRKGTTARTMLLATVLLTALAVRLYGIDSPLWLDEIYGYRLAISGPQAILQDSWTDPHPPLYYLVQWVISGSGQVKTEIGWRWLPLLSGSLLVLVLWLTIKDTVDYTTSIVLSLLAATSPTLVFYSQEARPTAFLMLVSSLSMWLTVVMLRDAPRGRQWLAWTILSLVGLYTGYAYVMVVSVQLLFLGFYYHRRVAWWAAVASILASSFLLLPFAASSLGRVSAIHANSQPLTFWRCLQTLYAGEPLRYGFSVSHTVLPTLAVGLFVASVARAIRLRDKRLGYLILQVALPMGAFFGLSPLSGIRLPPSEAKQFTILFPALLVLMAGGLGELCDRLGCNRRATVLVATLLCGAMLFLNAVGLHSYWSNPKSPEGFAALRLRDKLQSGESVVSLHYSATYALGFYTSGIPTYLDPKEDAGTYSYRVTSSERVFERPSTAARKQTEDIRASGQFWVLAHSVAYREPMESLLAGCVLAEQETFSTRGSSFVLMKVDCLAHD